MKPRAVRISMVEAVVKFHGRSATLVNISRTGALIRVHGPAQIGSEARLTLTHGHTTVEIDARVVRTAAAVTPGGPGDGDWHAGIAFVAPPPPEITALLRRIISLG